MRYVIYTRVSKHTQTVQNQLLDCKKYVYSVMTKKDEIIEFNEPDSSTQKPMASRKKLQEMMSFLREGDTLIVWKVDRLARDKQELINIYCDIRKKGVQIVGLQDPLLNEELICVYAFIACTERSNIQKRTHSGLNRKRANGERVGGTWFGYKLDETKLSPHKDAKSEGKPYLLIPNEEESEAVSLMCDLHQEGKSFGEIALELEKKGYKNRKGNPIHKMTVYRVLQRQQTQNQAPTELAFALSP